MKRTPEVKYREYLEKGRSLHQMMALATARGDVEFSQFLAEKKQTGEEEDEIYS